VCTSAGQAGLSVACRVLGALANERLTATAAYNPEFYREDLVANADGEANFRFTAPAEARGREITVTVTREDGSNVASDQLTIAAPGRTGEGVGQGRLARTGQDVVLLGAVGLVLLTGGVLARRRSVTQRDRKRIDA
jgi:LPXTG-motif cell wall-anchored protein